jgi:hypothetical protein
MIRLWLLYNIWIIFDFNLAVLVCNLIKNRVLFRKLLFLLIWLLEVVILVLFNFWLFIFKLVRLLFNFLNVWDRFLVVWEWLVFLLIVSCRWFPRDFAFFCFIHFTSLALNLIASLRLKWFVQSLHILLKMIFPFINNFFMEELTLIIHIVNYFVFSIFLLDNLLFNLSRRRFLFVLICLIV